ncbi:hypothetical protein GQR58_014128 [Nymphon striatum]|nr:hypothetical protein GQR58_014128 [Nymphon striatum]
MICTCRRYGLKCVAACGKCRGEICENAEIETEEENTFVHNTISVEVDEFKPFVGIILKDGVLLHSDGSVRDPVLFTNFNTVDIPPTGKHYIYIRNSDGAWIIDQLNHFIGHNRNIPGNQVNPVELQTVTGDFNGNADAYEASYYGYYIPYVETYQELIEVNKSSLVFPFSSDKKENVLPVRNSDYEARRIILSATTATTSITLSEFVIFLNAFHVSSIHIDNSILANASGAYEHIKEVTRPSKVPVIRKKSKLLEISELNLSET